MDEKKNELFRNVPSLKEILDEIKEILLSKNLAL